MPKLKKLEVQGFKSFADTLVFEYPTGITAIVGPNGSGKSNIADAIRWVLGEQRMTTIRGQTGADMIFAGSRKRSRSGMARTSITFDNTDGWLPVDFAEVTIERRTYRDGKTEYRLNGSRLRLKDLRDILDQGGLGRDAYLIVGQGLVDHVLSLKPQDRLTLFEQAAGISPYRTRREDTVLRLTDTQRNLERVYDIIGEIEPNLRRLTRQKAKAEQHATLSLDLNETLKIWYGYRWGKALIQLEQARLKGAYREDRVLRFLGEADAAAQELLEQRKKVNDMRSQLAALHQDSSVWLSEASNRQRELAVARERQRQIQERLLDTEANLSPLLAAQEAETVDVDDLVTALSTAEAHLAEAIKDYKEAEDRQRSVEKKQHTALQEQAHLRSLALEYRHRLADRQSRIEQAESRRDQLDKQCTDLRSALKDAGEQRRKMQHSIEESHRDSEAIAKNAAAITENIHQLTQNKNNLGKDFEEISTNLRQQRSELTQYSTRLDALNRLASEGTGLYAGVRAVLQATERATLTGLSGTVSSLIQVPPHLEIAIETALGSQSQNIVADGWSDAQKAIEWLKKEHAGRATFLPLDTLRVPRPIDLPKMTGLIGTAADLITYPPRYRPAILLLLGRTAVAQSLDSARKLYNEMHGRFRIVTLEGEIIQSGGAVTGGRQGQAQTSGLLARERERRELPDLIASTEITLHDSEASLQALNDQITAMDGQISILHNKEQEINEKVRAAERQIERQIGDLETLLRETTWQQNHLIELQQEQAQITERLGRFNSEREEAVLSIAKVDKELLQLDQTMDTLTDDSSIRTVAEKRTAYVLIEQEVENYRILIKSRKREADRLRNQINSYQLRIENFRNERETLSEMLDTLQKTYDEARTRTDNIVAQVKPIELELHSAEISLDKKEKQENEARRILREAEQILNQVEMESSRCEDRVQNLRHEIEESLGIVIGNLPDIVSVQQPLPLEAFSTPLPSILELPEGLEEEMRDLRIQIRRLEPVNLAAKQEYDELYERHSFLREQMLDLEKASGHLREVITELDALMEVLFSTTFKRIAEEFSKIFQILFDGGSAALKLMEGDGTPDGVEITARPPGKRTAGLGMLSGGERTLTAVALLFSVMQVSPAPFCVLDEVDAMLDEANVSRFRRMLGELANQTQFIIITHNRGTVEVADTIYGVSMQDDGVSQVLSLSIAELPANET